MAAYINPVRTIWNPHGLLTVGQTLRDVKQRIAEQLKTAAIKNYTIELDESADIGLNRSPAVV